MKKEDINELIDRSLEFHLKRNRTVVDEMLYNNFESIIQNLEIPLSPNQSVYSLNNRGLCSRKKYFNTYDDIKIFFDTEKEKCKYLLLRRILHYKSPYWTGNSITYYTNPTIEVEYFAAN